VAVGKAKRSEVSVVGACPFTSEYNLCGKVQKDGQI